MNLIGTSPSTRAVAFSATVLEDAPLSVLKRQLIRDFTSAILSTTELVDAPDIPRQISENQIAIWPGREFATLDILDSEGQRWLIAAVGCALGPGPWLDLDD